MTTLNKILLIVIGIILISAGGFIAYQQYMFNKQAVEIQKSVIEMKQLKDNIIRSQSQYVNQKSFDDFVKQNNINLKSIQDDVNSLGGKIVAVNHVIVNSSGQSMTNISSTATSPNLNPVNTSVCSEPNQKCVVDKFNYFNTTQKLDLNENFGKVNVPIGQVEFNAGTPDNKPWGYKISPRQYKIDNTIAHTGDGQTVIYNALTIKSGDDDFTIPITSSQTVERYPSNSFSWWNPRFALGFSGEASFTGSSVKGEMTPSLNMSFMSYGKTKTDPDMRILGVGVGYNVIAQKPALELSPIQFNIGKAISGTLLNNTYIGPTIGINPGGSVMIGGGMQVGL